jgi:hypothetical protein
MFTLAVDERTKIKEKRQGMCELQKSKVLVGKA